MRILVTGGCGFIGANLISRLREAEPCFIRVLDNESVGRLDWIREFDVDFVLGDIRDATAVSDALDEIDTVVHLAADTRVVDSITDPTHNYDVNVNGTLTLLETMRKKGVTRIVNASTGGAIIGEATPPVNEDMVARPASPYGAAKLAVEGYLSAYSASYGFNAVSLRFSNVYGRRSYHKGSVVAAFMRRIASGEEITVYGDGSQTRDYVFADDLCEGIRRAMGAASSGVYQLGTGVGTSINELIDIMRDVIGPAFPFDVVYEDFRQGELLHTWCDISKAVTVLGYAPTTRLSDGLRQTWSWFHDSNYRGKNRL